MQKTFVNAILDRVKQTKASDLRVSLTYDQFLNGIGSINYENATHYQLAFLSLLLKHIDKLTTKMAVYFDQFEKDNHELNLLTLPQEITPPNENSSDWSWTYETTLLIPGVLGMDTSQSGPILHFYFEGWDIDFFETYNFEEGPSRF